MSFKVPQQGTKASRCPETASATFQKQAILGHPSFRRFLSTLVVCTSCRWISSVSLSFCSWVLEVVLEVTHLCRRLQPPRQARFQVRTLRSERASGMMGNTSQPAPHCGLPMCSTWRGVGKCPSDADARQCQEKALSADQ